MESVREAAAADAGRIVDLAQEFEAEMATRRGAALLRPDDAGVTDPLNGTEDVTALLADPERTALVGSLDEWIAGVALLRIAGGPGDDRRGVIESCYVEPGARGVGLGHLLLEQALEWFGARRVTGVDGTAYPGDREAKSFFESAGFKARLLVMHRPLD